MEEATSMDPAALWILVTPAGCEPASVLGTTMDLASQVSTSPRLTSFQLATPVALELLIIDA